MNLHDVRTYTQSQIDLAHAVVQLVNAVERVHALHEPYQYPNGTEDYRCGCCMVPYPCETIQALVGEEPHGSVDYA